MPSSGSVNANRALHEVDCRRPPGTGSACAGSRRRRRRGPRSAAAILRRSCRARASEEPSPQGDLCESRSSSPFEFDSFTVLHQDIQGFVSHRVELETVVETLPKPPNFIALTETWLDESTKDITISNYELVARLDRRDGRKCGGIALFVHSSCRGSVVHVADSDAHERLWAIVHSDHGPVLLGVWYRPPCHREIASIKAPPDEVRPFVESVVHTLLVGDMNVHHKGWLRFSTAESPEGRALLDTSCSLGLDQFVKEPTRGPILLDLVLSDLGERLSASVFFYLASVITRLFSQQSLSACPRRSLFIEMCTCIAKLIGRDLRMRSALWTGHLFAAVRRLLAPSLSWINWSSCWTDSYPRSKFAH